MNIKCSLILVFLSLMISIHAFAQDPVAAAYQKTINDIKSSVDKAKDIDTASDFVNVEKTVGDSCFKFGVGFLTRGGAVANLRFSGNDFGAYPFVTVGFNAYIFGYKVDNIFGIRFRAGTWGKLAKADSIPAGKKWYHVKVGLAPLLFGLETANFDLLKNASQANLNNSKTKMSDSAEVKDQRKTLIDINMPIFPLISANVKAGPYLSWAFPFEIGFGEIKKTYNAKNIDVDADHIKLISESQSEFSKKLSSQAAGYAQSLTDKMTRKLNEFKFLHIVGFFVEAGASLSIGIASITVGVRGVINALSAQAKLILDYSTFRQYIDLGVSAKLTALSGNLYAFADFTIVCGIGWFKLNYCTSESTKDIAVYGGFTIFDAEALIGRVNTHFGPQYVNCLGNSNPTQCNPNEVIPSNPELITAYDYLNPGVGTGTVFVTVTPTPTPMPTATPRPTTIPKPAICKPKNQCEQL